jgi:hypothetical protein
MLKLFQLLFAGVCTVRGAVGTHEPWCPNYKKS